MSYSDISDNDLEDHSFPGSREILNNDETNFCHYSNAEEPIYCSDSSNICFHLVFSEDTEGKNKES